MKGQDGGRIKKQIVRGEVAVRDRFRSVGRRAGAGNGLKHLIGNRQITYLCQNLCGF